MSVVAASRTGLPLISATCFFFTCTMSRVALPLNLDALTAQAAPRAQCSALPALLGTQPTLLPPPWGPLSSPSRAGPRRGLPALSRSAAGTPRATEARCRWHTVPPIPNLPATRALAITLQGLEEVVLVDSRQSLRQARVPTSRPGQERQEPAGTLSTSTALSLAVEWVVSAAPGPGQSAARAAGWSCHQPGVFSPERASEPGLCGRPLSLHQLGRMRGVIRRATQRPCWSPCL